MQSNIILRTSGLTAGYGKFITIREIDILVKRGEVVGIAGKNGVGKSTLARSIMGLLNAKAGAIELEMERIEQFKPKKRAERGIGYVPQGRHIFDMLVRDNLQVGRRIGQLMKGKGFQGSTEHVYTQFPILKEFARRNGQALSGGQQQMLAIGRALAGCVNLLILDEPSEGIQPSIVKEIGASVKAMAIDNNIGVILIEQNLDLLMNTADRIYVMEKGSVVREFEHVDVEIEEDLKSYLIL